MSLAFFAIIFLSLAPLWAGEKEARVTILPTPESGRPAAAQVDADDTIHLLYSSASGLRYAKSTDNGKSFGAPISVVDKGSKKPGLVFDAWDMALDKQGRAHVALGTNAWKLKLPQKDWGFHYATLEPGAKEFTPVRNINGKPSEGFSLAVDDKGSVAACWLAGKLYLNVSKDHGKSFGSTGEINPAWDPCNCCTTSATFGADGKLAVLYREETDNERDMYLGFLDVQGKQTARTKISTTPWKLNTCPMTYYKLSRTNNGFLAAWPTGATYDIYFARLDTQGKVLPPGEIRTPGHAGHRTGVLALSAPDGSTLIAWSKDKQLGWQLYRPNGQPSGSMGSAQTTGDGVAGIVTKQGNFILFR